MVRILFSLGLCLALAAPASAQDGPVHGTVQSVSGQTVTVKLHEDYRVELGTRGTVYDTRITLGEETTVEIGRLEVQEADGRTVTASLTGGEDVTTGQKVRFAESSGISRRKVPSEYTLDTQGRTVLARTNKDVEWRYSTERPDPEIVHRADGTAFVVDGESYRTEASHVYALSVATGDVAWVKEIGDYTRASLIDVGNEIVLVSHSSGIYALDSRSGEQVWKYADFSDGPTSFTRTKGTLFFLDGQPVSAHELRGGRATSTLFALDSSTGKRLWSKEIVSEPQKNPLRHADYEVEGKVVVAENKRVGRTYRFDLKTGKKLQDSGPSRCSSEEVKEIAESAFGAFTPSDLSPDVAIDLNGDGVEERFYQQLGTNSQGQIKVIAVDGTVPCRQIFSTIVYSSDWKEDFTALDRRRNEYRLIEIGRITYAFDGQRYTRAD